MDSTILTTALTRFVKVASHSYANIYDEVRSILTLLLVLETVLCGIWLAFGRNRLAADTLFHLFKAGFWMWVILWLPDLSAQFINGFVKAGFDLYGYSGSTSILMNPSKIFGLGIDLTANIQAFMTELDWYQFGPMIIYALVWVAVVVCFGIIAIQVLFTVASYYLIAGMAAVMLPFAVFRPSTFMAERILGALIQFGARFLVLAAIIAFITALVPTLSLPASPTITDVLSLLVVSLMLLVLGWMAPSMAGELLGGPPSLTAGSASLVGAFAAAGAGAMTATGWAGARASGTAASGATRAAARLGGNISAAYTRGSAFTSGSALQKAAGGAASVGSSLGRSAVHAGRDALAAGTSSVRYAWQQGTGDHYRAMTGSRTAIQGQNSAAGPRNSAPPRWVQRTSAILRHAPRDAGGSAGAAPRI